MRTVLIAAFLSLVGCCKEASNKTVSVGGMPVSLHTFEAMMFCNNMGKEFNGISSYTIDMIRGEMGTHYTIVCKNPGEDE